MTAGTLPSSDTWERINQGFLATGDWSRALAERTAIVDGYVAALAHALLLRDAPGAAAVVAVGGYGRRELFPHSDIDLLLLFENDHLAEAAAEPISALLRPLWDAGLRVSHSVRTPEECGQIHDRNAELNVSLLDQRYLAGDRVLYASMAERLGHLLRSQRDELARHLARLARERHGRYEHTYCHLEPNIKETPGGMRDLQLARWLERLRGGDGQETEDSRAARQFLSRLRCWLHCRAGRDDNALTFEAQEGAAERWGDGDAARWMREYFRHARAVHRAARRGLEEAEAHSGGLFTQFHEWRSRLSNAEFSVSRERVHLRVPHSLDVDPDILLRLFQFVARHGVALAPDARQRVTDRLPRWTAHFAQAPAVWPALAQVLALPHAPLALREMHETGVLGAIFPEFARIECLAVRDFYHRFTVDEHSLAAVRALYGLPAVKEGPALPYAELFAELEHPALLVFALLFHDVGKGSTPGRHVEGSLAAAEAAMVRLQVPPHDRQTVRFLIRQHLSMPALVRSRDPLDPATARDMAHLAGTVEDLKALTLVSWADVSAVAPGVMTPWRAAQLWRLYLGAYQELTRELDAERIESAESAAVPFLEGFPTRYLRTHGAREMEAHRRLEEVSRASGVATAIARAEGAWCLTLVARDRPFLFASAAGTLSSWGMNILKAEAFGNRAGTVLDTFTFSDPLRTLELNPTEVDRLRATVERVLSGKIHVRDLLRHRPRPAAPSRKALIAPTVAFDGEASPSATLIQIVAQDRPGLLYDLASAISSNGCNIEVVLVDTEAHKAIDVFYVTSGGGKLSEAAQEALGTALRAACAAAGDRSA